MNIAYSFRLCFNPLTYRLLFDAYETCAFLYRMLWRTPVLQLMGTPMSAEQLTNVSERMINRQ